MWNDGFPLAFADIRKFSRHRSRPTQAARSKALCRTPFARNPISDGPQKFVAIPPASGHAMDVRVAEYTKTTAAVLRVIRNRSPEKFAEFGFGAGWRRKTASRRCRGVSLLRSRCRSPQAIAHTHDRRLRHLFCDRSRSAPNNLQASISAGILQGLSRDRTSAPLAL